RGVRCGRRRPGVAAGLCASSRLASSGSELDRDALEQVDDLLVTLAAVLVVALGLVVELVGGGVDLRPGARRDVGELVEDLLVGHGAEASLGVVERSCVVGG